MLCFILTLSSAIHVITGFEYTGNAQYGDNAEFGDRSQYAEADSPTYAIESPYAEGSQYPVERAHNDRPEQARGHTYTLEADIPELIRYFFDLPGNAAARSQSGRELPNHKLKVQVTNPDWSSILDSLKTLFRRANLEGAYAEEGPGTYKSESVLYPKNYQEGKVKKLLALKKSMDARNKDLNEGREN